MIKKNDLKKRKFAQAKQLKAHANGRNKSQQLLTLLGVIGQQCCARLHGPKSLTGFKLYATSANKCQHCCGSMQTDATSHNIVGPNNVGCCWPTMLGLFAWALKVMLPLTNISRERSSFCYFLCRIQNKNSPPFPRLKYVLTMFLFLPFGSSKKALQKECIKLGAD